MNEWIVIKYLINRTILKSDLLVYIFVKCLWNVLIIFDGANIFSLQVMTALQFFLQTWARICDILRFLTFKNNVITVSLYFPSQLQLSCPFSSFPCLGPGPHLILFTPNIPWYLFSLHMYSSLKFPTGCTYEQQSSSSCRMQDFRIDNLVIE